MFLTIPNKIHNASNRKIAILEKAFLNNTLAYDHILEVVKKNFSELKPKFYWKDSKGNDRLINANRMVSLLSKVCKLETFELSGPLRESVCKKAASNILSYLANPEAEYPKPERYKDRTQLHSQALDRLRSSTTKEEEDKARDEVWKLAKDKIAPLSFQRKRDFKLFYDKTKNNYYVLLSLFPSNSAKIRKIKVDDRLQRLGNETEVLPNTKTSILLPLEFGIWQEEFLKDKDFKPKIAELFRKPDGHYFNITFEVKEKEKIEPQTYLGIDLGLGDAAAWTVIDPNGAVIKQDILTGKERLKSLREHMFLLRERQRKGKGVTGLRRKRRLDELAHLLSNQIIETGLEYKSRIVLEDLRDIRKRSSELNRYLRRLVNAWNFNELQRILQYKAELQGLPKPFYVRAHYTSLICPKCLDDEGKPFFSKENREPLSKKFKCIKCGYENNANINASENIARRALTILQKKIVDKTVFIV